MPKSRRSPSHQASGRSATYAGRPSGAGKNQLRIISGQWRGRKLPFPDGEGLRPTGDRMRETLFNWLSFDLYGRRVLDLFAGSGALGLEALSRGAASAVFLDNHPGVVQQIRQNLAALDCDSGQVFRADALSWLPEQQDVYDLVFLDPPFGKGLLLPVCQALVQHGRLAENALVYVESERGFDFSGLPSRWSLQKEKQAGQVICRLYRVESLESCQ